MSYLYIAKIVDEETDEVLIKLEAHSQESLEEDMGKSKWTEAVKQYEAKREDMAQAALERAKENEND